jgi:hypothetical protein
MDLHSLLNPHNLIMLKDVRAFQSYCAISLPESLGLLRVTQPQNHHSEAEEATLSNRKFVPFQEFKRIKQIRCMGPTQVL